MTRYVAGFVFATGAMQVMLIQKRKPAWQNGRLNAVGGKIEQAESAQYAMMRECMEETDVRIAPEDWRRFCVLRGQNCAVRGEGNFCSCCDHGVVAGKVCETCGGTGYEKEEWEVHFFTAELSYDELRKQMRTKTAEPVALYPLDHVTSGTAIPNLPWLIAMARNMDKDLHTPVREYVISEQY